MSQKRTIGVLFGGRSTEHQVSLVSASSVMSALNTEKYDIVPIGITLQGQWMTGKNAMTYLKTGSGPEPEHVFLPADPAQKQLLIASRELSVKLDVIFPVLHGSFGEDGTIQGVLELADLPYVGAGVLGSAVCMDKIVQKQVCLHAGLPTVPYKWLHSIDWQKQQHTNESLVLNDQIGSASHDDMLKHLAEALGFPVFVKPASLGSSVGITKAKNVDELRYGIEQAVQYDRKVLVEAAVNNAREIEVSVLGNEHPKATVPGEVIPSNEFYDYDAKYVDGASDLKIPAELPESLVNKIQSAAIKSAIVTGVEGMARIDFLVNSETNEFVLNEINTIPGFTEISMYPKLWEASGLSYSQLLDELINLALERHSQRASLSTRFNPKEEWYR